MKKWFLAIILMLTLSACSSQESLEWEVTPAFTYEDLLLYGEEGAFGIQKVNGTADEHPFLVNQGRHYKLYFLSPQFEGTHYKLIATHESDEKSVLLYESTVSGIESGGKWGFDKSGLWKLEVWVDGETFAAFIIEAKDIV